jgi:hypothetical protein
MSRLRDLLGESDPLALEGDWSADARARVRQTMIRSSLESGPLPRRRSVVKIVAAVFVVAAGLGVGARLLSPGGGDVIAAVRFEVRLAEETPGNGLRAVVVGDSKRTVYLHQDVVVSNGDIAKASAQPNRTGDAYSLAVTFTAEGARKMEAATRTHQGKPLALLIDGQVVTCPTVRGVIRGSAIVDASYTKTEADRIVAGVIGR